MLPSLWGKSLLDHSLSPKPGTSSRRLLRWIDTRVSPQREVFCFLASGFVGQKGPVAERPPAAVECLYHVNFNEDASDLELHDGPNSEAGRAVVQGVPNH